MPSQRQRRLATRGRILDAAVAVLIQHGYAATSTTRIVAEAGVSRGAMLHHFPTKAVLMRAVLDHVLDRRLEDFHRALAHTGAGADRVGAVIDSLWGVVSQEDSFVPWLELTVAARSDPELLEAVQAAAERTRQVVQQTFEGLFDDAAELSDLVPGVAISLMNGMAMRQLVAPDPQETERTLVLLRQLAGLLELSLQAPG